MFTNYNYKKLLTMIIGRIPYDINHETFKKLNITIDTINKKKSKKLNNKEIDDLNRLIRKINNSGIDDKFKETISRNLKLFLIYGNIDNINHNYIELNLTNAEITSKLTIYISPKGINMNLNNDEYSEKAIYNDFLTIYKTKKTMKEEGTFSTHYDIKREKEVHLFKNNKEVSAMYTKSSENYSENKGNKKRNYSFSITENFKDVSIYYREDGYIINNHKVEYLQKSLAKRHNIEEYKISLDYNRNEKHLNTTGYYQDINPEEYNDYFEGNIPAKQLIKQNS